MYFNMWIPFLVTLILAFYLLISHQLVQLRVEHLKNQSYQSQIYAIQYLKNAGKENGEVQALKKGAKHFAVYMAGVTGYRIQIYDKDGLLADSDSQSGQLPETKDIQKSFETKAYSFFLQHGMKYLSFSSPIISLLDNRMGQVIGSIRYVYPLQEERMFLLQVMGAICLLSLGILIINGYFLRKNADSITESVRLLKEAAIQMQNGDLSQEILISSADEMEELGVTFDLMRCRLKEYISRLDEQSNQLQRFYNNVAHQLKTPLTSIIGYSQMIQISNDFDSICEDAFIIEESGEKLLHSIDVLLKGAKREALYVPLHISRFMIFEVVEDAARLLKPRLDRLKVAVMNNCDQAMIQSDREKIIEIILTLMDNALIHSECRQIEFWTEVKAEKILLHFKDDGKGIAAQDEEFIFNAFYQGDSSKGMGSGLGLSICFALAKDLAGSLQLKKSERGAEFVIEIPNLKL